jgi:hypothetical protein
VLIFYGIGLEMYGRVSLTAAVAGSAAFFLRQMIALLNDAEQDFEHHCRVRWDAAGGVTPGRRTRATAE